MISERLNAYRGSEPVAVLQAFVTGEKCDHRKYLCQGELTKAIKLLKDPINILGIRTPVASKQAFQAIDATGTPQPEG